MDAGERRDYNPTLTKTPTGKVARSHRHTPTPRDAENVDPAQPEVLPRLSASKPQPQHAKKNKQQGSGSSAAAVPVPELDSATPIDVIQQTAAFLRRRATAASAAGGGVSGAPSKAGLSEAGDPNTAAGVGVGGKPRPKRAQSAKLGGRQPEGRPPKDPSQSRTTVVGSATARSSGRQMRRSRPVSAPLVKTPKMVRE